MDAHRLEERQGGVASEASNNGMSALLVGLL